MNKYLGNQNGQYKYSHKALEGNLIGLWLMQYMYNAENKKRP